MNTNLGIGSQPKSQFPAGLPEYLNRDNQREIVMKEYPTQEQLKRVLDYDKTTGIFTWKKRPLSMFKAGVGQRRSFSTWNTRYAGEVAGKFDKKGYISIRVYPVKTKCLAHRLAWLYVYGYVPDEIDHEDQNKGNNAISNLRELDRFANQKNRGARKDSASGVNGVTFDKRFNKWRPRIKTDYRGIALGLYNDLTEAVQARYDAEVKYGYTEFNPNSTAYQYLQNIGA